MKQVTWCFSVLGLIAGCGVLPESMSSPENEFVGPLPVVNATPADNALECLSRSPEVLRSDAVFAVDSVGDLTRKTAIDETGNYIPQDTASMLVTALSRAGVQQVNRINTAVTEFEIARARDQILGDGGPVTVNGETVPYRPLRRGSMRGSDYIINGAITQLDFNTYSEGTEFGAFGAAAGTRVFALTVGADIRVTETQSTRIVLAEAYSKQAVGREQYGSVFRFFSDELFDVRIGRENLEGLHAGIRWMLAEAAYDIVSSTLGHDGSCDEFLPDNEPEGPLRTAAGLDNAAARSEDG